MKCFLLSLFAYLFLYFQGTVASVEEYQKNNVRVIICDDFILPITKVGVFYSVGSNLLKNICEAKVIEKIFLSEESKTAAKKLGTDISFSVHDNFSEVSTVVSNEQILDVIKIILENKPDVESLPLIKTKIKIKFKLSDYFETNLITNEIYAKTNPIGIFNESILDNLTIPYIKNSLNKYAEAHTDIIICGKFNKQYLVEKLNLKPSFPTDINVDNTNQLNTVVSKLNVEARSKFLGRSLYYMYGVSTEELLKKQRIILSILNYRLFTYLKKYSQLLGDFFITDFVKPNFILLGFTLKRDISQKFFESSLKNLFSHLKNTEFSFNELQLISKLEKFSETNVNEDINMKYNLLKEQYIFHSQPKGHISEEILGITSQDIKNFIEQVMENNFVAKISTQYKAEN